MNCPQCGNPTTPGLVFCRYCGTDLRSAPPSAAGNMQSAQPSLPPTVFASNPPVILSPHTGPNSPAQFQPPPAGYPSGPYTGAPNPSNNPPTGYPANPYDPPPIDYASTNYPPAAGGYQSPIYAPPPPVVAPSLAMFAFPADTPSRVALGGLAIAIIAFFLPWTQINIPLANFGSNAPSVSPVTLNGIAYGWLSWLVLIVLVAAAGVILCQNWLYLSRPHILRSFLGVPFALGALITGLGLYTIIGGSGTADAISQFWNAATRSSSSLFSVDYSAQIGLYLLILAGIVLTIGGYMKIMHEIGGSGHP